MRPKQLEVHACKPMWPFLGLAFNITQMALNEMSEFCFRGGGRSQCRSHFDPRYAAEGVLGRPA